MTNATTESDTPNADRAWEREFLAYGVIETAVYLWGVKLYLQRGDRLRALGGVALAGFNVYALGRRLRRDG